MPEIMYDTQEAVPEAFRAAAVAKDGKFSINVVEQVKLDEFRDNNINLSRERDNLNSVIGRLKTDAGFDPEAIDAFITDYADLKSIKSQVDDGKLIKDTSLNEAVAQRTNEMRAAHEQQVTALTNSVKALQTENSGLKTEVQNNIIDREITAAAGNERSGLRPDAIRAVIREAREFFQVIDGKLVAKDASGAIVYGSDGTAPMTPLEWIKTRLSESAPYLFKESTGGGSQGGSGVNGMTQEQLNALPVTERMRLARAGQA